MSLCDLGMALLDKEVTKPARLILETCFGLAALPFAMVFILFCLSWFIWLPIAFFILFGLGYAYAILALQALGL